MLQGTIATLIFGLQSAPGIQAEHSSNVTTLSSINIAGEPGGTID